MDITITLAATFFLLFIANFLLLIASHAYIAFLQRKLKKLKEDLLWVRLRNALSEDTGTFELSSYAGGAHPDGLFSHITMIHRQADNRVKFITYTRDDLLKRTTSK